MIEAETIATAVSNGCSFLMDPPDEHLLWRFLHADAGDAQSAFDALVERHGPMVLAICHRILGHQQDAEDAYQATFLTLARKAGTIRDGRALAGWLQGVATRCASGLRSRQSRRLCVERRLFVERRPAPAASGDPSMVVRNEIAALLHDEIGQLPDKYRNPVVLCYLEGRTNEEVAELLSWPVGTVKGRLSRARELLRTRLLRRGLALAATLLIRWFGRTQALAEVVEFTGESAAKPGRTRWSPGSRPNPTDRLQDGSILRNDPGAFVDSPCPSHRRRPRPLRKLVVGALLAATGALAAVAATSDGPTSAWQGVRPGSSGHPVASDDRISPAGAPDLRSHVGPDSPCGHGVDR